MKKIIFILFPIFAATFFSFAQVTPEAFISMLPAIPQNPCADDKESSNAFFTKLDSISFLMDNEFTLRQEESENNSEDFEKENMNKIASQYGLSQGELEKLQNDENLSEEEQAELINKIMKKKYDISLKEVENLEKLDKEGQNAWSEAYTDQKMAEVQYDTEKNEAQQIELKNSYELGVMRKHLTDSLTAIESKFAQQFDEIDKDPKQKEQSTKIMNLSIEANNLMGEGTKAKLDAMVEKLRVEMDAYCNNYTNKYVEILRRYESYTKSCLPVCYKLEKIIAQHTKLQTGVEMKYTPGYVGLQKVLGYRNMLRGAYKYNLKVSKPEQFGLYE